MATRSPLRIPYAANAPARRAATSIASRAVHVVVQAENSGVSSLTQAGKRPGLSQPATSYALGRILAMFDDPLFVRTPEGMLPTSVAQRLKDAIGRVLAATREALRHGEPFDPATSTREFRVSMSDVGEQVFLPSICERLQQVAPGVRIAAEAVPLAEIAEKMRLGRLDFALGNLPSLKATTAHAPLFNEQYTCMTRKRPGLPAQRVTAEQFQRMSHIAAASLDRSHLQIEESLRLGGLFRRNRAARVAVLARIAHEYLRTCLTSITLLTSLSSHTLVGWYRALSRECRGGQIMPSIDFVEVAQKGGLPVVAMGHVNVQEIVASQPHRRARLRVFSRRIHGQPTFTFSKATFVLTLVHWLARPDSEFRNVLTRFSVSYMHEAPQLFFKATHGHECHVEHLHFHSWQDLEPLWTATLGHALWISAEGPRSDLLKLLDSIRDETADDCDGPSLAESSPVAAVKGDPQQEAIAFRNELLSKNWPDGKRVAEMAGAGSRSNPHQYAARQRSNGALLGVWVAAERTYRHPDFQFDAHGGIRPAVTELLKVLPGDEEDKNGWRRAFWLYSPRPLLSGETPADVFVRNPQRVIEAAREEFCGDANAHW